MNKSVMSSWIVAFFSRQEKIRYGALAKTVLLLELQSGVLDVMEARIEEGVEPNTTTKKPSSPGFTVPRLVPSVFGPVN